MKAALICVLLAACGGTMAPPPVTTNQAPAPSHPGPPYTSLFVAGSRELPARLIVTFNDEPVARTGTVTCTASDVSPAGSDHRTMRLVCEAEGFEDEQAASDLGLPGGMFAMRADGLWAANGYEVDDVLLQLMPVSPVAGPVTQPPSEDAGTADGESEAAEDLDGFEESISNEPFGDGWCIADEFSMRREYGSWTLCFDATGIVGGGMKHAGYGSTEELTFGKAPE